ncbi:MAG: hypothetical protein V2B18_13055, partial [Pseudomonadota bacterium]
GQLAVRDAEAFSIMVEAQAKTIIKAGYSLAKKLGSVEDPENLIRSFRFLVNRSVNRILDNTFKTAEKSRPQKPASKKVTRGASATKLM